MISHAPCTPDTEQCDFLGRGELRPDCCTEHMLELLTFTHQLLDAQGIPHWLDWGTLLGAVRNGEFIPWDDDVDLGIPELGAEALARLTDAVDRTGYRLFTTDGSIHICLSKVNGLHLDLCPWTASGDLLVAEGGLEYYWPGMNDRASFPHVFVDHLREVSLYGAAYPAPAPVHVFLEEYRYGPDYMTPVRPPLASNTPSYARRRRFVISSSEMTPAARSLLARLGERDADLFRLARAAVPFPNLRLWDTHWAGRLVREGLPQSPRRQHLDAAWATVPAEDRSVALTGMVSSLAATERGIEEYEHRRPLVAVQRLGRRASWASGIVARRGHAYVNRVFPGRPLRFEDGRQGQE